MGFVAIEELFHPTHTLYPFTEAEAESFPVHEHCPVCEAKEAEIDVAALGQPEWKSKVRVVLCRSCGTLYYANPPGSKAISDYYSRIWNSRRERRPDAPSMAQKPVRKMANLLQELGHTDKSASVFDLGCGRGGLLRGLREAGYHNLCGLEASEVRAAATGLDFPGQILSGSYDGVEVDRKFKIIYSNHVFEHLYRPAHAFAWMVDHLSDDGVIILATPNFRWESVINQVLFLPHLHSLTHRSFELLAAKHAMRLCFWRGARKDEICAVFYRAASPISPTPERFSTAQEHERLDTAMQLDRTQRVWREILADSGGAYTYGATHMLSDPKQQQLGYAHLKGWQRAVLKFGGLVEQTLLRLGFPRVARHLAFLYSRISRPGCQIVGFIYVRFRANGSIEGTPVIGLPDGRAAFHIK